jgi:hypothetical protein
VEIANVKINAIDRSLIFIKRTEKSESSAAADD